MDITGPTNMDQLHPIKVWGCRLSNQHSDMAISYIQYAAWKRMLCKNSLEMNIYNEKTFSKRVTSVMCIIRINDMFNMQLGVGDQY